jgi:hypothetical protein
MRSLFAVFILLAATNLFPSETPRHEVLTLPQASKIKVNRHINTNLSLSEAQLIFASGLDMLARIDSPPAGDVATNLPLVLDPTIGTFSYGTESISSCDALDKLFADKSADIYVVSEIHCCGGITTTAWGCSGANLPLVVFSDPKGQLSTSVKGILWMHEYGHHKGLCHNLSSRFAVMAPVIRFKHTQVNQCESMHFTGAVGSCGGDDDCYDTLPVTDASSYAHQTFIEGIPYDKGNSLPATASSSLIQMLNDPSNDMFAPVQELYWSNAVTLLGMIGDLNNSGPLISFLENSDRIEQQPSQLNLARKAVPIALGYILAKNRNNSQNPGYLQIRDYLMKGLHPEHWSDQIKCVDCTKPEEARRNAHLTTMAILGIALSGDEEASHQLQNLQTIFKTDARQTVFEVGTVELIQEAVRVNSRIRAVGLSKYYNESAHIQLGR